MKDNILARHFPAPDFLDVPYVGIDISPMNVRMMEIIDSTTLEVGSYAEVSLSKPFIITDTDNTEVKEILKKWKKEYKLEYIKASLPEEKAYLFDTEVEYGNEAKMRSAIEFSLEENVPLSGTDVIFDYRLVGESPKKDFIKVAVTVLPCDVVTAYSELFHQCDLKPISYLIEAQASSRALIKRGDRSTYIVVNINTARTGIFVVSGGAVQFTSTIPIGSTDFTKAIADKLSVDEAQAEMLKETRGFVRGEDGIVLGALMNTAQLFVQEIDKVYVYWNKHRASIDPSVAVQKVLISGKDGVMPGFKEYLGQMLKMSVEVGNVWSNLSSFEKNLPPIVLSQALNFGAAIGLALPENE